MKRPSPPLNILIVEDEPLIAMDMEMMVEDAGHTVIAEAASFYDAQNLGDDLAPDIAFVDIQLAKIQAASTYRNSSSSAGLTRSLSS